MTGVPRLLACRLDGRDIDAEGTAFAEDRGLHYGDGLFETLIVRGGHVRFEALHRARLATGCLRLGLPCDAAPVFEELREFARLAGEAVVKLILTRGTSHVRGYAPTGHEVPRRLLLAYPAPAPVACDGPFTLQRLDAVYGENPALAGIKHLNRLEQVLARGEAQRRGADEGLVCSSSGRLVSGTMSNVFLLEGQDLLTPALHRCGIAGVTRAVVLREAAAFGLQAREADLDPARLDVAAAILVTNVRFGLRAATHIDGRALPPVTGRLQALAAHLDRLDA